MFCQNCGSCAVPGGQQPLVQDSWQGESLPLLPSTFSGLPWPHFSVQDVTWHWKKIPAFLTLTVSTLQEWTEKTPKTVCAINNHTVKTHGEVDSWYRHQMDLRYSLTYHMLHPCTQTLRWALNGQLCGSGSGYVRFEVLSVVTMNATVSCDVTWTPCSLVDVCTCFIHLAYYTVSHPRRQLPSVWLRWGKDSCFLSYRDSVGKKGKNFTLEQAMKDQKESRCIAVLFL